MAPHEPDAQERAGSPFSLACASGSFVAGGLLNALGRCRLLLRKHSTSPSRSSRLSGLVFCVEYRFVRRKPYVSAAFHGMLLTAHSESTPDRSRTCDISFRKAALYPSELRGRRSVRAANGSFYPFFLGQATPPFDNSALTRHFCLTSSSCRRSVRRCRGWRRCPSPSTLLPT